MSVVESLRTLAPTSPDARAQVWDCFNRGQVLAAAFEVHEVAMRAGFMPDEATTLSLSLADLGTQAVLHAKGGVATVFFSDAGWRLELADAGPAEGRSSTPRLQCDLPRSLSSLRATPTARGWLVIADYERELYQ